MAAVAGTRWRVATWNLGMSSATNGPAWSVRRPIVSALIKARGWHFVMFQEVLADMRGDLATDLGAGWSFKNAGSLYVGWQNRHFTALESFDIPISEGVNNADGTPTGRHCYGVRLQNRYNQSDVWAFSAHHLVSPFGNDLQKKSMQKIVTALDGFPGFEQANTIVGADLNSSRMDDDSPRGVARAGGLFDLRATVAPRLITNAQADTYTGYYPQEMTGEWIDDLTAGADLMPFNAAVLPTKGSDHNPVEASYIQLFDRA